MGPFNIKIIDQDREVTLTILPDVGGYYMVIYLLGVIGAVQYHSKEACWKWLSVKQISIGNLPVYKQDKNNHYPELVEEGETDIAEELLSKISTEIEHQVNP